MLLAHLQEVVDVLTRFGWIINHSKSQLTPMQEMIYLGSLFNTQNQLVSLTQAKFSVIREKVKQASGLFSRDF